MTKFSKESGEIYAKTWKEILRKHIEITQEYFNIKSDNGI